MKIVVQDDEAGKNLVKITDLGSGLEKVAVRVMALNERPLGAHGLNNGEADRRHFQRSLFSRMMAAAANPIPFVSTPNPDGTRTIEIRLIMPAWLKLPSLQNLWRRFADLPRVFQVITMLAVLIVVFGIGHWLIAKPYAPPPHTTYTSYKTTTLTRGTPNFRTVLPTGKSIASLGGWVRISPPDRNPVFAFIDHIGGVQISVSEQPLPGNFASDTAGHISRLAHGFNADEKITDSDGTIVYIGTSGNGQQSVILSKQQLLVLRKSVGPLTTNQWVAYTSSLE